MILFFHYFFYIFAHTYLIFLLNLVSSESNVQVQFQSLIVFVLFFRVQTLCFSIVVPNFLVSDLDPLDNSLFGFF